MIRLVSAWVLINGLLMLPVWLSGAVTGAPASAWLSLEATLIVGVMALLPRHPPEELWWDTQVLRKGYARSTTRCR